MRNVEVVHFLPSEFFECYIPMEPLMISVRKTSNGIGRFSNETRRSFPNPKNQNPPWRNWFNQDHQFHSLEHHRDHPPGSQLLVTDHHPHRNHRLVFKSLHQGSTMKPGDLIHTKSHAKEILPTVTLGGLGGPRVPNISGHIGTILQVSDWWGETWIQW